MRFLETSREEIVGRIKTDLEDHVGARMKVRANIGRCKIIEKEGTIQETHPHLFVVRVDEEQEARLVSYSYADVLTKTVELTHLESGENLLPWLTE
ncbi:MAG: Veg family protein [Terriglobia bacterium]